MFYDISSGCLGIEDGDVFIIIYVFLRDNTLRGELSH